MQYSYALPNALKNQKEQTIPNSWLLSTLSYNIIVKKSSKIRLCKF